MFPDQWRLLGTRDRSSRVGSALAASGGSSSPGRSPGATGRGGGGGGGVQLGGRELLPLAEARGDPDEHGAAGSSRARAHGVIPGFGSAPREV